MSQQKAHLILQCTAQMHASMSLLRLHLVPEGAAACAAALLAALADVEEDVGLQQGRLEEGRVRRLPHRLPARPTLLDAELS